MTSKQRCLATIRGQPADRTPVFPLLMFLAADRLGVSYRQFATDGRALAEAQIQAYRRFGVDAITACSDAFRISADLGGDMRYPEASTPHLARPLVVTTEDVAGLRPVDPTRTGSRMADRVEAVHAMVRTVGAECLVLGWVDMPFAEACAVCGVQQFLVMLVDEPALAHRLLAFLTGIVIAFAQAQVAAGAPMIGAGDAAASLVSAAMYREFALPYEQQVCQAVHDAGGLVKLHICGDTRALLRDLVTSGADLFNVDHLVPLEQAAAVFGGAEKAFKGNLDPVADLLRSDLATVRTRAANALMVGRGHRYLLSAGCEVPAGVSDEVFAAFCRQPQESDARAGADPDGLSLRGRTSRGWRG